MDSSKKIGDKGEIIAIEYLKSKGYTLIETNFMYGKYGEVDIVCMKELKLIFVEVRFRRTAEYGSPEETITMTKKKRLRKTIEYYCLVRKKDIDMAQCDFIGISLQEKSYRVKHFRNIELV